MSETPTTADPVRQERKTRKTKTSTISILFSVFVFILFVVLTHGFMTALPIYKEAILAEFHKTQTYMSFMEKTKKPEPVIVAPVIPPPDPEITIVKDYIKLRNTKMPSEVSQIIAEIAVKNAKEHNIATPLIVGVMEVESTFNPSALADIPKKPGEYARGLMQIYQAEEIDIDKEQAFDIKYNVSTGCRIINKKLEITNGDLSQALSNYSGNRGGYTQDVMLAVGRFTLYKWEVEHPQLPPKEKIEIKDKVEVSMLVKGAYKYGQE